MRLRYEFVPFITRLEQLIFICLCFAWYMISLYHLFVYVFIADMIGPMVCASLVLASLVEAFGYVKSTYPANLFWFLTSPPVSKLYHALTSSSASILYQDFGFETQGYFRFYDFLIFNVFMLL